MVERPARVEERIRIGDWEADIGIGKLGGAVLVTLAERKSRVSLIAMAKNKAALAVKAALWTALRPVAKQVSTLPYDIEKEFALHTNIEKELEAKGFFAHP